MNYKRNRDISNADAVAINKKKVNMYRCTYISYCKPNVIRSSQNVFFIFENNWSLPANIIHLPGCQNDIVSMNYLYKAFSKFRVSHNEIKLMNMYLLSITRYKSFFRTRPYLLLLPIPTCLWDKDKEITVIKV